jgi:Flp pilus assembly protein TadG
MMRRKRFLPNGQSLVEFALVLPMIFAFVFAIIEAGITFSIYVGLVNSTREAARAGAMYQYVHPPDVDETPAIETIDAQRAAIMDKALLSTLNPMIDADSITPSSERYTYTPPKPAHNYRYGDRVEVSVAYNHKLFFGMLGRHVTLRVSSEMRLEPGGR